MAKVPLILVWLIVLAVPLQWGGVPWLALCLVAVVVQLFSRAANLSSLITLTPAFLWIGVHNVTANRELFFPYGMYLATHTALLFARQNVWLGTLSGLSVVLAFLVVRILQAAPVPVLILEFGIALAILEVAMLTYLPTRRSPLWHLLISAMASLLALASLLI